MSPDSVDCAARSEGADEVKVRLADDREFDAKVIGRDRRLDLAVLQLAGAKDLPVAALGASEGLRVGEYVVAIGNPFGLGDTVTMGIVSAKRRAIFSRLGAARNWRRRGNEKGNREITSC